MDAQRSNASNLTLAGPQQPCPRSTRRYWTPLLAAVAFACSASPLDRATNRQVVIVDAGSQPENDAGNQHETDAGSQHEGDAGSSTDAGDPPESDAGSQHDGDAGNQHEPDAGSQHEGPAWCTVQAIFAAKCQRCHGSPEANGAPFSLVSYDDTQVLDRKGRARFERIAKVVEDQSMPPRSLKLEPPVEPLSDEERATILSWCAHGATPAEDDSCSAP